VSAPPGVRERMRVYCLGVDVGTTNCKALALDERGQIAARASVPMPPGDYPDAEGWLRGFRGAVRAVCEGLRGDSGALDLVCSITSQGGSFVPVDERFAPVQHAYCWTANARAETVQSMSRVLGSEECYRACGFLPSAWLAGGKMREFVASSAGERRWRYLAAVPEFIHARCGGPFLTDATNAQLTALYDFTRERWDEGMLRWAGLDESDLAAVVCDLRPLFECGLSDALGGGSAAGRIRFVTSSHDQYGAMLGAGLKPGGRIMIATGTAWVVSAKSALPAYDFENHLTHPGRDFASRNYGLLLALGVVGQMFDGLLKGLGVGFDALPGMEADMERVGPARGVVSYDADARSVSEDGRVLTAPAEAVRRYMEWAAARARHLLEQTGLLAAQSELVMTGGAAQSGVWPRIIADVLGVPIVALRFPELTAYGAARAAGMVAGLWKADESEWPAGVPVLELTPDAAAGYEQWYAEFQRPHLESLPAAP